jgi:hypothetical protein
MPNLRPFSVFCVQWVNNANKGIFVSKIRKVIMNNQLVKWMGEIEKVPAFSAHLLTLLLNELNEGQPFSESRAKALLRVMDATDDPTLADFTRQVSNDPFARVALYDLLSQSGLTPAEVGSAPQNVDSEVSWIVLALAVFAHKREYLLTQLDPASPPSNHSPAGQVVKNAGNFLRKQVNRGATERNRLAKKLVYTGSLNEVSILTTNTTADKITTPTIPSPEIFRPPVPVKYPELNTPIALDDEEANSDPQPNRMVITKDDLAPSTRQPRRQPPLRIDASETRPTTTQPHRSPTPLPPSAVIMPNSQNSSRPSLSVQQMRERFSRPAMKSTKLRVTVQDHPDGSGFYGIQVRVFCQKIGANVAGTTNRDGVFLCEIPVKENTGLTYDVEVTWHRDLGGLVEKKSVTLNADRTEFVLPFYQQLTS